MATEENEKIALFLKQHKSTPNIKDKPFHPSEFVNGNRNVILINNLRRSDLDDIVFINDYHFYCRLCEHHFYSCSKFSDTNSYFQPHINTVNHVWNVNNSKYDFNKDIFIWEKWLYSAFCNVCQMANVTAFIIDTKLSLKDILKDHLKGFNHADKYRVAYVKPWNRLLPRLDLVWTRHIYTIPNGRTECKLCFKYMETTALFEYHLTSASHALKFETLLKEKFGILTDSVTLDQVREFVKWISEQPECKESEDSQKLRKYMEQIVNSDAQFNNLSMVTLGFCPSHVKELLLENGNDVFDGEFCLLCDKSDTSISDHMDQNAHKLRWMIFKKCAPSTLFAHPKYIKNRDERLRPFRNEIRLYYQYKSYLKKHDLDFGIPYKPEYLKLREKVDESINTSLPDEKFNTSDTLVEAEGKKKEEEVNKKSDLKDSSNNLDKTEPRRESNEPKCDNEIDQKTEAITVRKVDLAKLFEVQIKSFVDNIWPINDNLGYCENCKEHVDLTDIPKHVLLKKHQAQGRTKSSLLSYLRDPNFSELIQKWTLPGIISYVCIACGSVMSSQNAIFHHIACAKHVKNFLMQSEKDLKLISISNFSIDYESQFWVCNVCHENVKEFTELESNGKNFTSSSVKCIQEHQYNCKGNPGTAFAVTKVSREPKKPDSSYSAEKKEPFENGKATGNEQGTTALLTKQQKKEKMIDKAETRKRELIKATSKLAAKHENELTSFLCMPCLQSDSKEHLVDHLRSQNHEKNLNFFISDMAIYCHYCETCKMLLLGNHAMLNQHFNSKYHTNEYFRLSGERIIPTSGVVNVNILIVRGWLGKIILKPLLNDLQKFGDFKWLNIKRNFMKVCFKEPDIANTVIKNESLRQNYDLNFSIQRIKVDDDSIGLRPTMINLLGRHENLMRYICKLVDTAFRIHNSKRERAKEAMVCESLKRCLSHIYPSVRCHIFGSRRTGLTLKSSDLDVFVDCGGYYFGNSNQDPEKQAQIVGIVCKKLKRSVEFHSVMGIGKCRVPIVTCHHKLTNMNCDLSFKNGLSCENTNLTQFMIKLDNRITPLILFLKDWIKINGLYGRPRFSSYALVMLVFYYLQQEPNPILPSVELLQNRGSRKIIGGWNCGFTTNKEDVPKTKNRDSLSKLLLGFFNFWIDFDFTKYVVSPLTGKPLDRDVLQIMDIKGLPSPYRTHSNKINPNNYCSSNSSISVMDPFDLDHNLTKNFPEKSLQKFIYLCRVSAGLLSNASQSKCFAHMY